MRLITLLTWVHIRAVDATNDQSLTIQTSLFIIWWFKALFTLAALFLLISYRTLFTVFDAFAAWFADWSCKIMVWIALALLCNVVQDKKVLFWALLTFCQIRASLASRKLLVTEIALILVKNSVRLTLAFIIDRLFIELFLFWTLSTFVRLLTH